MKVKVPDRVTLVHGSLALFAILLVGKAAQVQLWNGRQWAARGEHQQFKSAPIPAPRGSVLDATGVPLATSRERLRVSVAPRELSASGRKAVAAALARLDVADNTRRHAVDRSQVWVVVPGSFLVADVADLSRVTGVYVEPIIERVLTAPTGAQRLIGRVNENGDAVDGLELALNGVLQGRGGTTVSARDPAGHAVATPSAEGTDPVPGSTVTLTIRRDLQDIAEQALSSAVRDMHAASGDIVMLDPHTGDIAAIAGYSAEDGFTSGSAMTQPFEPGSTVKPLLMSRLLMLGRTKPTEVIETMNGHYMVPGRKTPITDDSPAARLTVAEIIQKSSNIGMVRLSERLTPREEFETYRDFGFGMATGVTYPSESPGRLQDPAHWSKVSASSMAMGYELSVTPMQLALAYASIANGGELLEPALVREVRTPDGEVTYRHERRVVRRVMDEETAGTIREMLMAVVDTGGTAATAKIAVGTLAGKTGTARLAVAGRGYADNKYVASFVGLFPADDPQYVILVKLENPAGTYGGKTAAPVTKAVLEAALVARDGALDRTKLPMRQADADPADEEVGPEPLPAPSTSTVVVALDQPLDSATPRRGTGTGTVPDVRRLPLRSAVFALHRAGFNVVLASGQGSGTVPEAGSVQPVGSRVRLYARQ